MMNLAQHKTDWVKSNQSCPPRPMTTNPVPPGRISRLSCTLVSSSSNTTRTSRIGLSISTGQPSRRSGMRS
jgi:hypothetical protein